MKPLYVLEDDPLTRRYLEQLIGRVAGWPVKAFADPAALLDVLADAPASALLLDITLRGARLEGRPVDGVQLCRRIKAELGPAAPPVVLLTAHAVEGDRERFLRDAGADSCQSKPIYDEDAFLDVLRALMGRAGAAGSADG